MSVSIEVALRGISGCLEKDLIEKQLLTVRDIDSKVRVVMGSGFAMYKFSDDPFLLATLHDGTYVPEGINMGVDDKTRNKDEDLYTGEFYLPMVMDKGGIWLTSHWSRFIVDLNRPKDKAFFQYGGKRTTLNEPSKRLQVMAKTLFDDFYCLATSNIRGKYVFSGHSMCDGECVPDISVITLDEREGLAWCDAFNKRGFSKVGINTPFEYSGGYFRVFSDMNGADGSMEFETNKKYLQKGLDKHPDFNQNSRIICDVTSSLIP